MAVPFCMGKVIDIIYSSDPETMKNNLNVICSSLAGVFLLGGAANGGRVYIMLKSGKLEIQRTCL